jgi:hypothetical protein
MSPHCRNALYPIYEYPIEQLGIDNLLDDIFCFIGADECSEYECDRCVADYECEYATIYRVCQARNDELILGCIHCEIYPAIGNKKPDDVDWDICKHCRADIWKDERQCEEMIMKRYWR